MPAGELRFGTMKSLLYPPIDEEYVPSELELNLDFDLMLIVNIHLNLQSIHHMYEFQQEIRRVASHKLPKSPNPKNQLLM